MGRGEGTRILMGWVRGWADDDGKMWASLFIFTSLLECCSWQGLGCRTVLLWLCVDEMFCLTFA